MNLVSGEDPGSPLQAYFYRKVGLPWSSDLRIIGLQRQDLSIAAAVAYTTWLEDSVFMHVAVEPHGMTRAFLCEAFTYPFVTCKKSRVYGLTPITAQRALVLSKRLGFLPVLQSPDFLLQVMTREDCRWIDDDAKHARNEVCHASSSWFGDSTPLH